MTRSCNNKGISEGINSTLSPQNLFSYTLLEEMYPQTSLHQDPPSYRVRSPLNLISFTLLLSKSSSNKLSSGKPSLSHLASLSSSKSSPRATKTSYLYLYLQHSSLYQEHVSSTPVSTSASTSTNQMLFLRSKTTQT